MRILPALKEGSHQMKRRICLFGLPVLLIFAAVTVLPGCPVMSPSELFTVLPIGPPPKGAQYVDVGGYEILYRIQGEAAPTVVLINGLDENIMVWNRLQPQIAEFAKVVAYDRGGVGWSDPGSNPRVGSVIVAELKAFLRATGLEPPYVLCAHSIGGLFARLYAHTYPEEIAGIVLIDTTHEDYWVRTALELDPGTVQKANLSMGLAQTLVSQVGAMGEFYNAVNTTNEVRANRRLPEVPLIILSQDKDNFTSLSSTDTQNSAALIFRQLYQEQARLVPNGFWRIIEDTGHLIQWEQPEAVAQAVRDVIQGW